MLEKTCLVRNFEFFKNISFIKKNMVHQKIKVQQLRKFNKYDMWEFHVGTLLLTLYFNFGISVVDVKNKIQTSFKSLVSKKSRTFISNKNFYKCLLVRTWNKNIY